MPAIYQATLPTYLHFSTLLADPYDPNYAAYSMMFINVVQELLNHLTIAISLQ